MYRATRNRKIEKYVAAMIAKDAAIIELAVRELQKEIREEFREAFRKEKGND